MQASYLWLADALSYGSGLLDDVGFVQASNNSQLHLCQSHYLIGVTCLAKGDRLHAAAHFQASADTKAIGFLETHMSRALLAQLKRDPEWPSWIKSR